MHITTVIIGAGHAGLAMSSRLTEHSIDHVVLERGEVANSWRTERWDSLRLLTPNWQSRLPDKVYGGDDPGGFMTMPQVIDFISEYSADISAPVELATTVTRLGATEQGYEVVTTKGTWTCDTVVVASGPANIAKLPAAAAAVPAWVETLTPMTYRNPDQLRPGGVLIVGASASGVQLAEEIRRSGRPVTLATGEHVRMPRTYRGRDIFWWMDRAGVLDERHGEVNDIVRARHVPSPQLIGTPQRQTIDLNTLRDAGVKVVGRLGNIVDGVAQFSGALANVCNLADLKMNRLLDTFDEWAQEAAFDDLDQPERFPTTRPTDASALEIHLRQARIDTIVWATGYRPDYSWLDLLILDRKGYIRHDGGVASNAAGVYLLGASVLRRRRSSYMSGAEQDTAELSAHLHAHLSHDASGAEFSTVSVEN